MTLQKSGFKDMRYRPNLLPATSVLVLILTAVTAVTNDAAHAQQKIDALSICEEFIKGANETMPKESAKTRRAFTECESSSSGLPVAVLRMDYKSQQGKAYKDIRGELIGADLAASHRNGFCNFGDFLKLFDVRLEFFFEGQFKTATTTTYKTCLEQSKKADKEELPHKTARAMAMMKEQIEIDKLGVEKYLAGTADELNKSSGKKLNSTTVFHSSTSTENDFINVYQFLVPKASIDKSQIRGVKLDDLTRTCNQDSFKLLLSHYDVTIYKRYLDSESNLVFEVVASRDSCRRLWR